jgi:large subunit ribosomal protein L22
MFAKAISKYTRISPKKAILLTRLVNGMTVAEAHSFLRNINKRASYYIQNVLKSAFDNARKKDPSIKEEDLYISKIVADSGPMLKRYRAASMGRAVMIRRRTSHLTVHLDAKQLPTRKGKKISKKIITRHPIFNKKKAKPTKAKAKV